MEERKLDFKLTPEEAELIGKFRKEKKSEAEEKAVSHEKEEDWIEKAVQYYVANYDGKYVILSRYWRDKYIKINCTLGLMKIDFSAEQIRSALKLRDDECNFYGKDFYVISVYNIKRENNFSSEITNIDDADFSFYREGYLTFPFWKFYNPFIPNDYPWNYETNGYDRIANSVRKVIDAKVISEDDYKKAVKQLKDLAQAKHIAVQKLKWTLPQMFYIDEDECY